MEATAAGFEAWVLARRGTLARSAYLLTRDVHLAEDLAQDSLARVAGKWRRAHANPDAYARPVMHHLAIDGWRRRTARPREVLTDRHPELGGAGPDVERPLVLRDGGEGKTIPADPGLDISCSVWARDALSGGAHEGFVGRVPGARAA